MSFQAGYYKLFQVDIVQASQLYLGGGINQPLPSSGQILYSDGIGGTFFSTASGNTGNIVTAALVSTVVGLGTSGYISTSFLSTYVSTVVGGAIYFTGTLSTPQLTSTVDGLGNSSYLSTSQLISTINGLGNIYVSTKFPGYGDVTSPQLFSTVVGLGNVYVSTVSTNFIQSSQMISTTDGLGQLYLSSPSLISTVNGLGQASYLSTSQLTSTVVGLGRIYQSSPDVVLARYISVGVSTQTLQTNNSFVGGREVVTTLNAAQITFSTSLTGQNANFTLNYTSNVPPIAMLLTGPAGGSLTSQMIVGANNALTFSVDGTQNALITSEVPNVSKNPLILNASQLQATTPNAIFTSTTAITPNNTQILGSTISTSVVRGNQAFFSSIIADGSALYNINAVSTASMMSAITNYVSSIGAVSTPTLLSTIAGLPQYLGYLSTATLGPTISTALLTTSSAQVTNQVRAGSVFLSTTTGSSNLWIAAGAAAVSTATLQVSVDGNTWSNASSGGFSLQGRGVAFNGIGWVAVGQDANPANSILYSFNGRSWFATQGATFSSQGNGVAWNGRFFVAVGQDATPANSIKYSADGITWSNSTGPGFSSAGNAVAWNGRLWVAVGQDLTSPIQYSANGISWTAANTSNVSLTQYTVAWNGRIWLAGGAVSGSSNSVSLSKDGINWSALQTSPQAAVNSLAWSGIVWVAASTDNTQLRIRYSYDGIQWIQGSTLNFSSGGRAVAWNGSQWVQGGLDTVNSLRYSADGINWSNALTQNFTAVNGISWSSNLTPFYQQDNFIIQPQNVPTWLTSTNTLFFTPSAMTLNATVFIDNTTNRVGINCNAPSFDLDVYGNLNVSSVVFASSLVGDGSRITNLSFLSSASLFSTVAGLGSAGYLSTGVDYSSLAFSSLQVFNFVSTSTLNQALGSTTTSILAKILQTSTAFISTSFSTITAYTMNISSIATSSLIASSILASTARFSTLQASTFVFNDGTINRLLVSSIRFFENDGFIQFMDFQNSNVSTIRVFTSSLFTNTVQASNLQIGRNRTQTALFFYGNAGASNNTVIAEISTGQTTQELLIFRGSSVSDQIRVQTTGVFRLETGVAATLWPTTGQQANASLLVDANSNMTIAGGKFYFDATNTRLGINCNAPGVTLDVNGSIRGNGSLLFAINAISTMPGNLSTSTLITSSFTAGSVVSPFGFFSTITTSSFTSVSSFTAVEYTGSLFASTIVTSSIVTSSISTQVLLANIANFRTLSSLSSLQVNDLTTQRLLVSTLRFYDNDGFIAIPDLQSSNISAIAFYTSSVTANAMQTSNIQLGRNNLFTALQFYGLRGGFNNTVIAEQSTGATTQELLMFRGSSIADQIRIQTTGVFRVETGVPTRFYPNTVQLSTTTFLIDAASNINMVNSTFYLFGASSFIGIQCNAPGTTFDINGNLRASTSVFGSTTVSSLTTLIGNVSSLNASSIVFVNTSSVRATTVIASTATLTQMNAVSSFASSLFVSTLISTSTLQSFFVNANFGNFSTLSTSVFSTGVLFAAQSGFSSLNVSTATTAILTTQRLLTSSLRFYDGDGILLLPDIQSSNISTIAFYTSSVQTNTTVTGALRIGSNYAFSPIQFIGPRLAPYQTTVIAEQSTNLLNQELVFFKGSSTADQMRFQTTGQFRVEAGVSSRLFPNIAQQSVAQLLLDINGNMLVNTTSFFVDAVNSRIGANTSTPLYTLDVVGISRLPNILVSTATISSVFVNQLTISSGLFSSIVFINTSSILTNTILTSNILLSTIFGTSSIFSTAFVSSLITTSSVLTTGLIASQAQISSLSTFNISTGVLFTGLAAISTATISTLTSAEFLANRVTTSTLRFFGGDGYHFLADLQTSNVSTIASWTSSLIANNVTVNFSLSTIQQIQASTFSGKTLTLNNSTPIFTLEVNGNARISSLTVDAGAGVTSTNTTFSLAVWGAGGAARVGATTWTQISDRRIKENIVDADLTQCYHDIKNIPLRRFSYTSTLYEAVPLQDRNVLGFIAQEVSTIQPKSIFVSEAFGIPDLNWLNIDQMNMSLYGAVKQLITVNETLTSSFFGVQARLSTFEGGR
jgi:hypothetical protein